MNQQQSTARRRRMRMVAGAAVAVLALGGLTACEDNVPAGGGDSGSQDPSDDDGDGAGEDGAGDDGEGDDGEGDGGDGPAEADEGFLGGGETMLYDNGVELTLGTAEEFEPSSYVEHEGTAYRVEVSVTNGGDEDVDVNLLLTARAGDAGTEADRIFDSAELGDLPRGTVKPGRTATGEIGFDVPEDAGFIDVEVKFVGALDMDPAHWNLRL